MSGSRVQCDTGCGFPAGTAASHLVDLPSVPAQEIPAQFLFLCLSVKAQVSGHCIYPLLEN